MVGGTLSISVVAIMKTTCGGGSSIDLSRASKDCGDSRWTSSMMKILWRSRDRRDAEAGDDDVADLVDLGVGGGVDLEHVHVAPFGDLDARVADPARIGGRALLAVEAARQDAGGGGLADAARAGEDERLRDAVAAIAFRSVCVTARWPITSSKR